MQRYAVVGIHRNTTWLAIHPGSPPDASLHVGGSGNNLRPGFNRCQRQLQAQTRPAYHNRRAGTSTP